MIYLLKRFLFSILLTTTIGITHMGMTHSGMTSAVMAQSQPDTLPLNGDFANPCPEGEFLDLYDNVCHKLDKPQLGFDVARFSTTFTGTVVESACNEASLQDALTQAAGGGIVQIPACTFDIGRIEIPSNVIIQGAGVGNTVLTPNAEGGDIKLNVQDAQNVVVRDMTLDAGDADYVMLNIERTDNLLIERLEVLGSRIMGIKFWDGVRNITIRYSESHHHSVNHGIGSKDCSTGVDIQKCPQSAWSSGYSIYSNYLHHNGTHGINLHAINGEVAGNLSEQNKYGGKFFDAQDVWVHHNTYRDNLRWGLYMAPTLRIAERTSRNLYFYYNRFLNTGDMAWGITPGGAEVQQNARDHTGIYLIDNLYVGGKIDVQGVSVNLCPGTNEEGLSIPNARVGADAVCNMDTYPSLENSVKPALQKSEVASNAQVNSDNTSDTKINTPNASTEITNTETSRAETTSPQPTGAETAGAETTSSVRAASAEPSTLASDAEMPNVAANVIDGELDTRWSAEGDGQWIQLDLNAPALIEGVEIAFFTGDQRTAYFDVLTSLDGKQWITVLADQESSGTTDALEAYWLDALLLAARYVRIVGHGNSDQAPDGWNSISEINVLRQQPRPALNNSSSLCSNSPNSQDANTYCFCIQGQGITTCAP